MCDTEQTRIAHLRPGDTVQDPIDGDWFKILQIDDGSTTTYQLNSDGTRSETTDPHWILQVQKIDMPELDRLTGGGRDEWHYQDIDQVLTRKVRARK